MRNNIAIWLIIANLSMYSCIDEVSANLSENLSDLSWRSITSSEFQNISKFTNSADFEFQLYTKWLLFSTLANIHSDYFSIFVSSDNFKLNSNFYSNTQQTSQFTIFDNASLQNELNWNYYDESQVQDFNRINEFLSNLVAINNIELNESQYLTFVDTNKQLLYVVYYSLDSNSFQVLWKDLVTTWNYKLWNKFFNTPHLIIDRSKFVKNDWKAEWTWKMWFWPKWSRIRFLWDHIINKTWTKFATEPWWWYFRLSLALHTSNNNWDKKLWTRVSHWCIRVSKFMLNFLDKTWILDWKSWKYLIIWDYNSQVSQMKFIPDNS